MPAVRPEPGGSICGQIIRLVPFVDPSWAAKPGFHPADPWALTGQRHEVRKQRQRWEKQWGWRWHPPWGHRRRVRHGSWPAKSHRADKIHQGVAVYTVVVLDALHTDTVKDSHNQHAHKTLRTAKGKGDPG